MNRADFQALALMRLADAHNLFAAGRHAAAYYLGGYAVECALKACISKQTQQHDFPARGSDKHYVHDLNALINRAVLSTAFDAELRNRDFSANWNAVKEWSEESRYDSTIPAWKARALLDAIDGANGILPWVQRHW